MSGMCPPFGDPSFMRASEISQAENCDSGHVEERVEVDMARLIASRRVLAIMKYGLGTGCPTSSQVRTYKDVTSQDVTRESPNTTSRVVVAVLAWVSPCWTVNLLVISSTTSTETPHTHWSLAFSPVPCQFPYNSILAAYFSRTPHLVGNQLSIS